MLITPAFNIHDFLAGYNPLKEIARNWLPDHKKEKAEVFQRLQAAKQFIETNYQHSLTLEEMANVACVSKFHFNRLFKQNFGLNPYKYYLYLKLEEAARLLAETSFPVADIGCQLGYNEVDIFSRSFKNVYKLSPSKYRKKYQAKFRINFQECQQYYFLPR